MQAISGNLLLTGGTGFIGQSLVTALKQAGWRIFILTRNAEKYAAKNADSINYISSLNEIAHEPIDAIINLAGETIAQRWTKFAKQKIVNSRIETTRLLVDYISAASHKPSVFISGSAVGYYGTSDNHVFNESTTPSDGGDFAKHVCIQWEKEALKATSCGVRTVVLRMGAVLEKSGGMLQKLLPSFRLGMGCTMGSGGQWLSWIDRDDLIRLILFIISEPKSEGAINATAPEAITNREFCQRLAKILNRPCLFTIPTFVLKSAFGDMAEEIMLQGQNVMPSKAINYGFEFLYPTLEQSLHKILR